MRGLRRSSGWSLFWIARRAGRTDWSESTTPLEAIRRATLLPPKKPPAWDWQDRCGGAHRGQQPPRPSDRSTTRNSCRHTNRGCEVRSCTFQAYLGRTPDGAEQGAGSRRRSRAGRPREVRVAALLAPLLLEPLTAARGGEFDRVRVSPPLRPRVSPGRERGARRAEDREQACRRSSRTAGGGERERCWLIGRRPSGRWDPLFKHDESAFAWDGRRGEDQAAEEVRALTQDVGDLAAGA